MSTVETATLSLEQLTDLVADPVEASKHLIALVMTLTDENEEVRAWASDVLQEIEQPSLDNAAQLSELTEYNNSVVASWACKLLSRMGAESTRFQDAIATTLSQHGSISARQQAALALTTINDLNNSTLSALRQAAEHSDPRLSRLAQQAIAAHGQPAT